MITDLTIQVVWFLLVSNADANSQGLGFLAFF